MTNEQELKKVVEEKHLNLNDWRDLIRLADKWARRAVRYDCVGSEWQSKKWADNMVFARDLYDKATDMFNAKYGLECYENGWYFCPSIINTGCSTQSTPQARKGNDLFRNGKYHPYHFIPKPRTTSDDDPDVMEVVAFQKEFEEL